MGNEGYLFIIVTSVVGIGLYFLPSAIAVKQNHKNMVALFALNLLLGWTVLGWVGALVWSLSAQASPTGELKTCPFCAEKIQTAAVKCKHCGSEMPV